MIRLLISVEEPRGGTCDGLISWGAVELAAFDEAEWTEFRLL